MILRVTTFGCNYPKDSNIMFWAGFHLKGSLCWGASFVLESHPSSKSFHSGAPFLRFEDVFFAKKNPSEAPQKNKLLLSRLIRYQGDFLGIPSSSRMSINRGGVTFLFRSSKTSNILQVCLAINEKQRPVLEGGRLTKVGSRWIAVFQPPLGFQNTERGWRYDWTLKTYHPNTKPKEVFVGLSPFPVIVANEGLGWDSLLNMKYSWWSLLLGRGTTQGMTGCLGPHKLLSNC